MEFEQNGRTYGKTMEFSFWWKKVRAIFKKIGGKYVRTSTRGFNVCCFSYHFTRPSSTNLPDYSASLGKVNTCTCQAVNIVRPLSRIRQQVLMSYDLGDDYFLIVGQDRSQSRCPRLHKVRAQVTDSHNLALFFLRPPPSLYLCPSPGILHVIWLCKLCHSTHPAPSFSLGSRSRFN